VTFAWPQMLLLALPVALLLWRSGRVRGLAMPLRIALAAILILALARPELSLKSGGSDVVFVVDRSRSMPVRGEAQAEEWIRLAESQRRPGDRLGVLSFGRIARLELPLTHDGRFGGFNAAIDGEASNLAQALDTAGEVVPEDRTGRVIVVSDGRATGLDVKAAARRLAARGISVDYRWHGRETDGLDVAVTGLTGPAQVSAKEPFLLQATLKATAATEVTLVLRRNGAPVVKTRRTLVAGDNLLTLRDLIEEPGLAAYELRAEADGDGVVENDIGRAVVRVNGPARVLVVSDHPEGALVKALRSAGLEVQARQPFALSLDALDGVGALVLENIEAGRLSEGGLHVVAQYVREAGGGLVMTGGRQSFGEGGYRKSPVEDVLPVSLEIREEQRRAAVAMSIIMDCSCSMGVQVPDGRTKMELAAEGVVGALQLLNDRDEASVAMVDTETHTIFGLSPVADGLPLGKVASGFSGGGGIYVGEGLRAAKSEILKSDKPTRHVLLFSDAADSENPDDYKKTLDALLKQDVTVSVIGMGKSTDPDAELLREVAALGRGRIYFAEDATSLPRVFSQETIAVARATYIDQPTAVKTATDLSLLGKPQSGAPKLGGYNLTYLRPQASVGYRTEDDNSAPVVAFWPRGAGRVVAFTGEVDGKDTGEWKEWGGRTALFEQMVRWAMAVQMGPLDAVPRAQLIGNDLHVTLDFDPKGAPPVGVPTLMLLSGDGKSQPVELPMRWEDEDRVGAHFTLPGSGTWHPVVKLDGRAWRAPPVTLPWAPEFEPGTAAEGKSLLGAMAKAGSGIERLSMAGLFTEALQSEARTPLAPYLLAFAVLLLLAEVFVRRFFSGRVPRLRPRFARTVSLEAMPRIPAHPERAERVEGVPQPNASPESPTPPEKPAPSPEPEPATSDVVSALDEARARAKKRTGR
jgi:uncharacterized membrane protein